MNDAEMLCEKIRSIYPEIGECGGDFDVRYEDDKGAWAVELRRGDNHLTTYLDEEDTNTCMEGERCLSLGVKVTQLLENVERS